MILATAINQIRKWALSSLILHSLFLTSIISCNSQEARLNRATKRLPFAIQLGAYTKSRNGNNDNSDNCQAIAVDRYENIVCAGFTIGDMGEDGDGSSDIFIAKLDRYGRLLWITQLGNTTKEINGSNAGTDICGGLAIDEKGNIYCGGSTDRLMDGDPVVRRNSISPRTAADIDLDALVIKLKPDGKLDWVKQFGTSGADACNNIAVSKLGNIFCGNHTDSSIGTHTDNSTFEAFVPGASNLYDPYIAKITPSGSIVWIRQLGGSAITAPYSSEWGDRCADISVDKDENAYCGGKTNGSLAEENGASTIVTPFNNGISDDIFVWSVDTNGNFRYLKQIGIATVTSSPLLNDASGTELCSSISSTPDGGVVCGGTSYSSFGDTFSGTADSLMIKLAPNAEVEWVLQMGLSNRPNPLNTSAEECNDVITDSLGNAYCGGYTNGDSAEVSIGASDILIYKVDQDGLLLWDTQFGKHTEPINGSTSGSESCFSINVDTSFNVYCAGTVNGSFAEQNGLIGSDAFMLRIDADGLFY